MYKKQRYDGHSNPYIWTKIVNYRYKDLTFEEKLEIFLKESKEKVKDLKQEFVSNTESGKMAQRNAKYRSDKDKKDRGY